MLFLVHLPDGTGDGSWIKMNAGQSGFYRVNYDGANWQSLIHQLNTDHEVIYYDNFIVLKHKS